MKQKPSQTVHRSTTNVEMKGIVTSYNTRHSKVFLRTERLLHRSAYTRGGLSLMSLYEKLMEELSGEA
jgi:hypothetical protein